MGHLHMRIVLRPIPAVPQSSVNIVSPRFPNKKACYRWWWCTRCSRGIFHKSKCECWYWGLHLFSVKKPVRCEADRDEGEPSSVFGAFTTYHHEHIHIWEGIKPWGFQAWGHLALPMLGHTQPRILYARRHSPYIKCHRSHIYNGVYVCIHITNSLFLSHTN